jgi:hypothetical protein
MFFCFFADFVSRLRDVLARAFHGVAAAQESGGADNYNQARESYGEVLTHFGLSAAQGDEEERGIQTRLPITSPSV